MGHVPRWFKNRRDKEAKEQRERDRENKLDIGVDVSSHGDELEKLDSVMKELAASMPTPQEINAGMDLSAMINTTTGNLNVPFMDQDSYWSPSGMYWSTKKRVTNIIIEWEYHGVDVSSIDSPYVKQATGTPYITVKDQDGVEVDPELRKRILELLGKEKDVAEKDVAKVLAEWNDEGPPPLSQAPPGHKKGCVYRGSHHFACTCQPPTIWGKTKLWYCDCCEEPRSPMQYAVCAMCVPHEYSEGKQAQADHEAAKLDA